MSRTPYREIKTTGGYDSGCISLYIFKRAFLLNIGYIINTEFTNKFRKQTPSILIFICMPPSVCLYDIGDMIIMYL